MLRSSHVLSLALLISVPAFAMQDGKALVAAGDQEVAPSAALLSTMTLADSHQNGVATLAQLQQQETVLADAKKATSQEVSALVAQLTAKLNSKTKQIEGSTTTIKSFQYDIAKIKEDAKAKKEALETEAAQKEADLLAKIGKEEEAKKKLEAEAEKLKAQIEPKAEEKVEGPATKPESTGWFGWLLRK